MAPLGRREVPGVGYAALAAPAGARGAIGPERATHARLRAELSALAAETEASFSVRAIGRDGASPRTFEAGSALNCDTPFRIASITKTAAAAATLRLWEQGRVELDTSIRAMLSPNLETRLRKAGFETDEITVRRLLSHSAGLHDHGGDERFVEAVAAAPGRVWTRGELVALSLSYAGPQSRPGREFRYSDTGYILLGDILERLTGESLAAIVRRELGIDALGMGSTWWELLETPPPGAKPLARQVAGQLDATKVHASMDLFGGGGLVSTTRDLALLAEALFNGRIFDRPTTLDEMLRQGAHTGADQYRLGVFVQDLAGRTLYWHSGFWGAIIVYEPLTGLAIAAASDRKAAFKPLRDLIERHILDASF